MELKVPLSERLKGIPAVFGIRLNEEPAYRLQEHHGAVEIRQYAPMTLARVTVTGDFETYRERAFGSLAKYIFGGNEAQLDMPMTAPVLQETSDEGWTMSFILPRGLTAENAPAPLDSRVSLRGMKPRTVATLVYHGNNSSERIRQKMDELKAWIAASGRMMMCSHMWVAQYDAPMTIPFLKKNEIHVEVRPTQ